MLESWLIWCLLSLSTAFSTDSPRRNSLQALSASLLSIPVDRFPTTPKSRKMAVYVHCRESTEQSFRGQNVLLTGASGGLGRAFALLLAECGVANVILSARSQEALQEVATECRTINKDLCAHIVTADLSDPKSVANLSRKALEICPRIDLLINNGGVSSRSRFVDTDFAVVEKVMQINFLSGAALAKAVTPAMIESESGRIIWISSVQGLVGIPNRSSYAASKFAVQGYCESIRAELASSGVSVHTVSPGYIRTGLSKAALTGDGGMHGKMDATTESGADPMETAVEILDRVAADQVDFTVAARVSAVAAIWMRLLCPRLLRRLLVKRYENSQKEKED